MLCLVRPAATLWPSLLALALALGCADDSALDDASDTETSAGDDEVGETGGALGCEMPVELPEGAVDPVDPVPWQLAGEVALADDGSTATLAIEIPANQRYLAIRTSPVDGDEADNAQLCHDLLEAHLIAADRSLIPAEDAPLTDTDQRRFAGPGAGVFAFSNTLDPLLAPGTQDTLELRLQMRNCIAGTEASRAFFPDMATQLRVEVASEPQWSEAPKPDAPARLAARMLVAEDSGWGLSADDPAMAEAWAVAVERFAAANIELSLEAEGTTGAVGTLSYDATMLALRELHGEALACLRGAEDDERFVPVVAVPCVYLETPGSSSQLFGHNPHVPGVFDETTNPSLVVLAAGACLDDGSPEPVKTPTAHGLILAHEIGHYLGLHHSDVSLGEHLASGPEATLMRSDISIASDPSSAYFSTPQAEVMLRHPDLREPL